MIITGRSVCLYWRSVRESSIYHVQTICRKTNISYSLIRTCKYQGKKYWFFGNFWVRIKLMIPCKNMAEVIVVGLLWPFTHFDAANGTPIQIWKYLPPHMKIICWRFHIKTPFTFWDMRTWNMWKVCLQTFRNNRMC